MQPEQTGDAGKKLKKPDLNILRYAGLGSQLVGFIGVSILIGWGLDEHYHTHKPWFRLGFALAGCVGAIYYMIQQFNQMNKEN